ncbi:BZ3500_MvSof-1268-A1-R1_Chr1-3g01734 [Microbotryum saponariae]|uniref:BZ3500_MvSof-1268-A1-R1_Chr1-3g01734 protein n=1 Tax=Microbotryum saponariae TaxID=289078 RepID=A0A2X0KS72_9BASI|nr:BZ3500_MvSof-1268-A1-R1_Chr1-3g01734 [Microbotryum saponariae]SCZ94466.1 BZ3501_MvSof-1269-A2-R1_Chr1-3g01336 [Microbotryum saponariae]
MSLVSRVHLPHRSTLSLLEGGRSARARHCAAESWPACDPTLSASSKSKKPNPTHRTPLGSNRPFPDPPGKHCAAGRRNQGILRASRRSKGSPCRASVADDQKTELVMQVSEEGASMSATFVSGIRSSASTSIGSATMSRCRKPDLARSGPALTEMREARLHYDPSTPRGYSDSCASSWCRDSSLRDVLRSKGSRRWPTRFGRDSSAFL